jgi:hypothetical protein
VWSVHGAHTVHMIDDLFHVMGFWCPCGLSSLDTAAICMSPE